MLNLEHLKRFAPSDSADVDETWWTRYDASLTASALTPTARQVIEDDARYILEAGIFGDGEPEFGAWPATRQRTGLVMGAVQSGKTASMLGVTALALDAGVKIVVVLAGTRVTLWRQTYDRFMSQLNPNNSALVLPTPTMMRAIEDVGVSPGDLYQIPAARIRRALRDGTPLILIVMKHGQHLRAASRMLHERLIPQLDSFGKPSHLLILDDEADDGSILDSIIESDLDPSHDVFKQIPRHIVDLWSQRMNAPATAHELLFATYVGYTATPQANFLQSDMNPLAPRDFIAALRTPSNQGMLSPRSTTYREPLGLQGYYIGGEFFYRTIEGDGSLVVIDDDIFATDDESELSPRKVWIAWALRSYFVSGAIRLWRSRPDQRLNGLQERRFETREMAEASCPAPHTMLFHPSSGVQDHFLAAAELLEWGSELSSEAALGAINEGVRQFDLSSLLAEISQHEECWLTCIDGFNDSAAALTAALSEELNQRVATRADWPELRQLLETEIFPNVRISVINSDPLADDRPDFEVARVDASWRAPRDIYTIFVSGNVMARGLTLEGLATTLFLRFSGDPLSDTQMQMQRWFGYRGKFLDLCRVFLPSTQLNLFIQYNEADEALRRQIVEAMNESRESAPSPFVIEGLRFRATGKIAGVSKMPLSPGANPFIDHVNDGLTEDPNFRLLSRLFRKPSSEVFANGTLRGRILDEPLTLEQSADLLDQLRYPAYSPDLLDPSSSRWSNLEALLGISHDSSSVLTPLFRPPATKGGTAESSLPPGRCPYNIAAYLRLWSAALDRRARGLFPTEDGEMPWASLDLDLRRQLAPKFWVGIRYGSGDSLPLLTDDGGPTSETCIQVRPMRKSVNDRTRVSGWGSRNLGSDENSYLGDQLFDYHHHVSVPVPFAGEGGPLWRPLGAPGQILFHVIENPDHPSFPVVAVGIGIPIGGPDHFAATVRSS
jgi:hypothetical protein